MQLSKRYDVSRPSVSTCLLVLLTMIGGVVTSQTRQTFLNKINNKRLDVTAQNVTARSDIVCSVKCQLTPGCVSVNLSPDRRMCQLSSEEMSDVTSMQSAEGWSHIRKFQAKHAFLWKIASCVSLLAFRVFTAQINTFSIC